MKLFSGERLVNLSQIICILLALVTHTIRTVPDTESHRQRLGIATYSLLGLGLLIEVGTATNRPGTSTHGNAMLYLFPLLLYILDVHRVDLKDAFVTLGGSIVFCVWFCLYLVFRFFYDVYLKNA